MNFQESTTILNACTKNSGNLLNVPRIYTLIIVGASKFYIFIPVEITSRSQRKKSVKFLCSLYIYIYIYIYIWGVGSRLSFKHV